MSPQFCLLKVQEFQPVVHRLQDYGFAYCFTNSIIDNGISKPDDYDETTMLHLRNKLNSEELEEIGRASCRERV